LGPCLERRKPCSLGQGLRVCPVDAKAAAECDLRSRDETLLERVSSGFERWGRQHGNSLLCSKAFRPCDRARELPRRQGILRRRSSRWTARKFWSNDLAGSFPVRNLVGGGIRNRPRGGVSPFQPSGVCF